MLLCDLIKRFSKNTTGFASGKELEKSIEKAHTDMARRANGHRPEIQTESVSWLKDHFIKASPFSISNCVDFDVWHTETCNKYCSQMNSWIRRKGFNFTMTYGRAQKVLNMTFKYLYCTTAYKAKVESIAPFLHMTLDGYTLHWYRDIVVDFINKSSSVKIKKGDISDWSKMNEKSKRQYIDIQKDIRAYLNSIADYQYYINTEIISTDESLEEQTKVSNKTFKVTIPFDPTRKSPFYAEFIVWEGEIVRAKMENLFKGLNGIYKSIADDKWAINIEIETELKSKMSAILKVI
ncbi:MAG: hypothetical protein ACLSU0_00250 [Oscillospiraceae bacterium]